MTVWYLFDRESDVGSAAIEHMEAEFQARGFKELGVLRHVFGLRLWLASEGQLGRTREEVVEECRAYIEDMRASGELPEMAPNAIDDSRDPWQAYGGLSIYEFESEDYRSLVQKLSSERIDLFNTRLEDKSQELLEQLRTDSDAFIRSVCQLTGVEGSGTFARIPIMRNISPKEFVEAFAQVPAISQRETLNFVRHRYERTGEDSPRATEGEWIRQVHHELCSQAEASTGVVALRWRRHARVLAHFIEEFWGAVEESAESATQVEASDKG